MTFRCRLTLSNYELLLPSRRVWYGYYLHLWLLYLYPVLRSYPSYSLLRYKMNYSSPESLLLRFNYYYSPKHLGYRFLNGELIRQLELFNYLNLNLPWYPIHYIYFLFFISRSNVLWYLDNFSRQRLLRFFRSFFLQLYSKLFGHTLSYFIWHVPHLF